MTETLPLESPAPIVDYHPLLFEDAFEFLCFIDDNVGSGRVQLYPWQIESLKLLSLKKPAYSTQTPLRYNLCANNGSGKDAYVNAPWALFFNCCKIRSRVVVTSSSHFQLKNQTEAYIRNYALKTNAKLKKTHDIDEFLTIKNQHIVCNYTGSEIILFVTDEAGKAEGSHPFPDYSDAELAIILNEAKSIPESIYEALSRCTYTHWLEISSSGETSGFFYKHCMSAVRYPNKYKIGSRYFRVITSLDCPRHVGQAKIQADIEDLGENHPVVRSKHFSEFSDVGVKVCIPRYAVTACQEAKVPENLELKLLRAGLDIGAGVEPTSLVVLRNNHVISLDSFIERNTDATVNVLIELFQNYGLKEEDIIGDDNGIGQAVLDNLAAKGWNVCRVRAQHSALNKRSYRNRGAELYFNVRRIIEKKLIYISEDIELHNRLIEQLVGRKYKLTEGKIKLQDKAELSESPNDADALVLAFNGLTFRDFMESSRVGDSKSSIPTQKVLLEMMGGARYPNNVKDIIRGERPYDKMMRLSKEHKHTDIISIQRELYGTKS